MSFQSFEELEVWKKACRLAVEVYSELRDCKDFGLKEQMQRAAISIASNIAEGHERGGRDFTRFLRIAQGSCAELRTQIYIAKKVSLLDEAVFQNLLNDSKEISRMLQGLKKSITPSN